jgi:WD40 repeat protein
LISPQTADGLKNVAQFKQDEPASQWLWSPDGKLVVLTVKGYYRYDLAALKAAGFTSSSFAEQVITTSPDGALAVAMQKDGSLQIWDLAENKVKQTLQPADTSMSAAFSPDGKTLAVTSADNIAVSLWDVASGKQTAILKGFETAAPTYRVQFSPDGRSLVWIARATAQFMVIASGSMGSRLSFEDFINTLVFAPDGKTVAIADTDFVTLRQVGDGVEIQHLALASPAHSLAYSPDGKLLAFAVGNNIEIKNTLNGQSIATLKGHASMVRAVGFAPDGRSLVSGDEDGNVFVWRVQP